MKRLFRAIQTDAHQGWLPWPHMLQFRFTQIGFDPQMIQRNDRRERGARLFHDLRPALSLGDVA